MDPQNDPISVHTVLMNAIEMNNFLLLLKKVFLVCWIPACLSTTRLYATFEMELCLTQEKMEMEEKKTVNL